jgi:ribosomal protein S27AE
MIITKDNIREFIGKNVYLRLLVQLDRINHAGLKAIHVHGTPIRVDRVGLALLYITDLAHTDPHHREIRLALSNFNKKWVLYSSYGESDTNEGRRTCRKCGCPTTMKRDFNTFKVRLFCPRCHI